MQITCNCGKRLRVSDEAVGKRIKCPACGEKVLVQGEPPAAPIKKDAPKDLAAPRVSSSATKRAAPRADEEDEPRPRKKGRKKARGPSPYLWLGLGGGAAVLAVVALVLVIVFNQKPTSAPTSPDHPAAPNGPTANPPSDSTANTPAAQGPQVEITDAKVTVTGPRTEHVSVSYRFTQGKPAPGTSYSLTVSTSYDKHSSGSATFSSGGVQILINGVDGANLKPEDTVQNDSFEFHDIKPGTVVSFTAEMDARAPNGPSKAISKPFDGTATNELK